MKGMILKLVKEKWVVEIEIEFSEFRMGTNGNICEHSNETLGSLSFLVSYHLYNY
jgi:hypothetical protein